MATSARNLILHIIRRMRLVRPVDLEMRGIPRAQRYRLLRKGLVARQARGVYVASQRPYTTEHTLAQVAKRGPAGAFCLFAALRLCTYPALLGSPAAEMLAYPHEAA